MRCCVSRLGLLFAVALPMHSPGAQPSLAFQAGIADRISFEAWFASQVGPYRAGAEYWVAHRSNPRQAHCPGKGDQLRGCLAAQQRLAPSDARRRTEPDYRTGWNGTQLLPGTGIPAAIPDEPSTSLPSPPAHEHGGLPPHPGGAPVSQTAWAGAVAAAVVIGMLAIALLVLGIKAARRKRALHIAIAEISAKSHLLHIRHEQLTQPDFYGTSDTAKWEQEKARFVETRIVPLLRAKGFSDLAAALNARIMAAVETAVQRRAAPPLPTLIYGNQAFSPSMDPLQYETYCASQLQKAGWITKPTPRSGDQGADIVAERNGVTLVAQCKRYSSSVGNGAVQEVVAGRMFYKADLAIVISNARFTKSAIELARASEVALLHHSQLPAYMGDHRRAGRAAS